MSQRFRLPSGGIVDRGRVLAFDFDGTRYQGYGGDTLASALLANGVHLVARSFKYHRPRGIFSAGAEEPNALVQHARGARTEPNVRSTTLELYDGLTAAAQNCWPSVRFDVGAINDAMSALIPAGFYYKTFMWPPSPQGWLRYEHAIRRSAGMGRAAHDADPDAYEHQYAHCDVLVIGAGVTGLAAALAATRAGARVIVCDETPACGGALRDAETTINGQPASRWIDVALRELASGDATVLSRTTAFGYYDGNLVGALERVTDHLATAPAHAPRQRLWKIRAAAVVLASGAIERGIAYADNDLPGTMLASAARTYAVRYGVRPGRRCVIFTNNDGAYADALALHRCGVEIAAIVDVRAASANTGTGPAGARAAELPVLTGTVVQAARGRRHVAAVDVVPRSGGATQQIACDLVCVSGGWNPAVHLFSQARGSLRYDTQIAAFVPDASPLPIFPAGAANGCFDVAEALAQGHAAGGAAAARAGLQAPADAAPRADARPAGSALEPLWAVPARRKAAKRFVDLQNDVTVADIALAAREGYQAVEHLKRYTTLGMGTDQGKTSNVMGLALLADALGVAIPQVGTTTFRPPYTPVTLGAFQGRHGGAHIELTRHSAMHDWHARRGARLVNAGLWKRPHSYPRAGETEDAAALREARNVRTNVGVVDVSTLGKIELSGRDVAELLNRVYVNRWDTLAAGRCRYGVMLRDDGMVMDDGTTSRLSATRYLMTTTTVNAVKVMQQLDY
ncbi:MAG: 2Fe-2S iron-sulfur cluster-binding protein, partial [Betaproteobacteria bacterium]